MMSKDLIRRYFNLAPEDRRKILERNYPAQVAFDLTGGNNLLCVHLENLNRPLIHLSAMQIVSRCPFTVETIRKQDFFVCADICVVEINALLSDKSTSDFEQSPGFYDVWNEFTHLFYVLSNEADEDASIDLTAHVLFFSSAALSVMAGCCGNHDFAFEEEWKSLLAMYTPGVIYNRSSPDLSHTIVSYIRKEIDWIRAVRPED